MSFTRTLSNQAGLHHNYVIEAVILHVTHMGRRGLNRQGLGRFHREPKMYPYAASEFLYKLNMLESTFSRFSIRTHTFLQYRYGQHKATHLLWNYKSQQERTRRSRPCSCTTAGGFPLFTLQELVVLHRG